MFCLGARWQTNPADQSENPIGNPTWQCRTWAGGRTLSAASLPGCSSFATSTSPASASTLTAAATAAATPTLSLGTHGVLLFCALSSRAQRARELRALKSPHEHARTAQWH